mgnify:CR=1 FL=1
MVLREILLPILLKGFLFYRTGVEQGDVIKLTGEGGAGPRGHAPGDLFVKLQVSICIAKLHEIS